MSNNELTSLIVSFLKKVGVNEIIFCPGSYNSPLLKTFSQAGIFNVTQCYDERSASFFALGVIKKTHAPVAVCTTSGTAVAECLPAVIEASYSSLPLIIISADRPARFIFSGAPQVIDQRDIFKSFVLASVDLERTVKELPFNSKKPFHINVRFEEPLFGSKSSAEADSDLQVNFTERTFNFRNEEISSFLQQADSPLVILSNFPEEHREDVVKFLVDLNAPVLAESRARDVRLSHLLINGWENLYKTIRFHEVIRIGGTPLFSLWRELERDPIFLSKPVLNISSNGLPGIARECETLTFDEVEWNKLEGKSFSARWNEFTSSTLSQSKFLFNEGLKIIKGFPKSELAFFLSLSQSLPASTRVFLGNSLPVREWSMFPSSVTEVESSRGVNGIDGQLATFTGFAEKGRVNVGIFGDLTALYDLSSLPFISRIPCNKTIICINNGGGKIFERLSYMEREFNDAEKEVFLGTHPHILTPYFEAAGFTASSYFSSDSIKIPEKGNNFIEIFPDDNESRECWKELEKL